MVTLEQVKLLETKITKAIDIVKKVTDENSLLRGKLDSYQKRIDELEILIQDFKEEQGRIEDGVLSALDRLNQFEDAVETAISRDDGTAKKPAGQAKPAPKPVEPAPKAEPAAKPAAQAAEPIPAAQQEPATELIEDEPDGLEDTGDETEIDSGELELF
jgi:predicted nuclease with TOPRIM domain